MCVHADLPQIESIAQEIVHKRQTLLYFDTGAAATPPFPFTTTLRDVMAAKTEAGNPRHLANVCTGKVSSARLSSVHAFFAVPFSIAWLYVYLSLVG